MINQNHHIGKKRYFTIYSIVTQKFYSSEEECNKDVKKFERKEKLNKLNGSREN